MEGNKDESERCIDIALGFKANGDFVNTKKFLEKSLRLYPNKRAEEELTSLKEDMQRPTNSYKRETETTSNNGSVEPPSSKKTDQDLKYTASEVEAVQRVKRCTSYYDMLGVSPSVSHDELKRAYRRLALLLHPDKNKAPGAVEAFKMVGKAFSVLSDPSKRERYNISGDTQMDNNQAEDPNYDEYEFFNSAFADDSILFTIFTNGLMSGPRHVRRRRRHGPRQQQEERVPEQQVNLQGIMLLLPLFIFLLGSLFLQVFLQSSPPYSFYRTSDYKIEETSFRLGITYYTKEKMDTSKKASLEVQIEREYLHSLQQSCLREQRNRLHHLDNARFWGSSEDIKAAESIPLPSCEQWKNLASRS